MVAVVEQLEVRLTSPQFSGRRLKLKHNSTTSQFIVNEVLEEIICSSREIAIYGESKVWCKPGWVTM
jgi:hypothetical protein